MMAASERGLVSCSHHEPTSPHTSRSSLEVDIVVVEVEILEERKDSTPKGIFSLEGIDLGLGDKSSLD